MRILNLGLTKREQENRAEEVPNLDFLVRASSRISRHSSLREEGPSSTRQPSGAAFWPLAKNEPILFFFWEQELTSIPWCVLPTQTP